MSEVMPFDSDQRQTIGIRPTQVGTSASLPDVRQVLLQHVLERCAGARAQPEPLDGDVLPDPKQNAAPFISSGYADTRLIGGIATMKLEHSILWSFIVSGYLLRYGHARARKRGKTTV